MFMYVEGWKGHNGTVEVFPHEAFSKITTALKPVGESVASDGSKKYTFEDYDQLLDCPIEIGNQKEFSFQAAGIKVLPPRPEAHHPAMQTTVL